MNTTTRAKDVVVGDEMLIRVKQDGERKRVSAVVKDIIGKGKQAIFTFTDESLSPRLYRRRKRVVITGQWTEPEPVVSTPLAIREKYGELTRAELIPIVNGYGMKTNTKTTKLAMVDFLVEHLGDF